MTEIYGKITDYSVTGMTVNSGGGMRVPSMSRGVVVTHLPTGITVTCDTETSQHYNREKCLAEIKNQLDARSI